MQKIRATVRAAARTINVGFDHQYLGSSGYVRVAGLLFRILTIFCFLLCFR